MKNRTTLSLSLLLSAVAGMASPLPAADGVAAKLDRETVFNLANTRPTPIQYAWQQMEFTVFLHFGVNTFTDREWGNGKEDPNLFQPSGLDTDQWCKFFSENGYKMVILTVKHHDGFCLWPSRYTNHSVKSSSWRGGRGDVFKDLAASARKYGLKLGFYLSPADLYQMESKPGFGSGLYGNLSKPTKRTIPEQVPEMRPFKVKKTYDVEVDDYNAYFMDQLFELLTEYGPISEVWFDGAHPKHKGGQKYRKDLWGRMIRELQPGIIIHGNGFGEMRWVGNELGFARENEWNVLPRKWAEKHQWMGKDLGSRKMVSERGEKQFTWLPSETDVSIRPGWFYHKSQDNQVKSPEHLFKIYLESIGRNSTLLLNYPPDKRGLIHENDIRNTEIFHKRLTTALATDFAKGAAIRADHSKKGHGPEAILDGNPETWWTTDDWQESATLELALRKPAEFNMIVLQEEILRAGQRIESFRIEAETGGQWKEIARAGSVGYKRVLKLARPVTAGKLRLVVEQSRFAPTLSHLSLHNYPDTVHKPQIEVVKGLVKIAPPKELIFRSKRHTLRQPVDTGDYIVRYTTDGSEAGPNSPVYQKPFEMDGGTLRARCFLKSDGRASSEVVFKVPYPREWVAGKVLDKEKALVLSLKERRDLTGFAFHPGPLPRNRCLISSYSLFVSEDGKSWKPVLEKDAFGNIKNNPVERTREFAPVKAKFVKFVWLKSENGKFGVRPAQIKLYVSPK